MTTPPPDLLGVDAWQDPLGTGLDSQLDRDLRFLRWRDNEFIAKLAAVEQARWRLGSLDYGRLADPRLAGYRPQVERLGREVAATIAELLAALPQPEPERARLVERRRGR